MTNNMREQVTEWLTGSDTCFLIGAGCSVCAGKPLIGRLTKQVLEGSEDELLQQFRNLRQIGDRPATIEDLINYLLRYRGILEATYDGEHPVTIDEIDHWLTQIKQKIVDSIDDDWKASSYHPGLFIPYTEHRRIASQLADLKLIFRPGITRSNFPYCDNLNLRDERTELSENQRVGHTPFGIR